MEEPKLETVAEFDAFLLELSNKADALMAQARELRKRRDLVFAKEQIATKVQNMSVAEREAMRQALGMVPAAPAPVDSTPRPSDQSINVHGIASAEHVSAA